MVCFRFVEIHQLGESMIPRKWGHGIYWKSLFVSMEAI